MKNSIKGFIVILLSTILASSSTVNIRANEPEKPTEDASQQVIQQFTEEETDTHFDEDQLKQELAEEPKSAEVEYSKEELDALLGQMKQEGRDPASQSMNLDSRMFFRSSALQPYWKGTQGNRQFYNGYNELYGGGNSMKVIDVSEHQGVIDWDAVKNSKEVDGVIVRIGFGTDRLDHQFNRNISELNRLGIPYGLYLYSYAEHKDHAIQEAMFVTSVLNRSDVKPTLPVYYDIEKWPNGGYTENGVWHACPSSVSQYMNIIPYFINYVRGAGYADTYVYSYRSYVQNELNHPTILKDVSWIAEYGPKLNYNNTAYSGFTGWQYSSDGRVPGISNRTDMNSFYGKLHQEPALPEGPRLSYKAHNMNMGWGDLQSDGGVAGSPNNPLRLEAIRLSLVDMPNASISGRVHVAFKGWIDYSDVEGKTLGTTGESKAIEAIDFKLNGSSEYKLQYRVKVSGLGWLEWIDQGNVAGTTGSSTQVEAIQFKLVPLSQGAASPSFTSQSHIQNVGWTQATNSNLIGSPGSGKRLEAVKIIGNNIDDITGEVHIQYKGWVPYRQISNGSLVGTTGESLRIEAINFKLKSENQHLRYRVYITGKGWTTWSEGGVNSGTTGQSLGIEAIELQVY